MIQDVVFGVLLGWLGFWSTGSTSAGAPFTVLCDGALSQGGFVVCQAPEGTRLSYNQVTLKVRRDGYVVFGLPRDADPAAQITANIDGIDADVTLTIEEREDPLRVIRGLDCDKVDARTPEQKAQAETSWLAKQAAFAEFHSGMDWLQGFDIPANGPPSSPFGPQRRYIGVSAVTGEPCEKTSVHRGYDIATPVGTPLRAPAGGVVTLANPNLYYEGGTVFLDHGHGLISVFIHLSEIEVMPGDRVERGTQIGKTGNTGRTTGPHLHWAVKWRNTSSEDRAADFYIDPALLLETDFAALFRQAGPSTDGATP